MIDEVAVERVLLRCPEGHWEQEVDYDVVRYVDPDGGELEFYSVNGEPMMSPFDRDGAPFCPECGRPTVARLLARRVIALPAQERRQTQGTPRRPDAPLLEARSEPRTGQPDRG